jgi:predicted transcriptional regulator
MSTVSLKIPPALDRAVEELAASRGVSKSAVIREALERYLTTGAKPAKASFLALAKEYAGCVEGPPGLSSNADHLDGYGE